MDWKFIPFPEKPKTMKNNIKTIHCDNTGKNKTLNTNCAKHFKEISFEFMSTDTPQKNSMSERVFSTL